MNEKLRKCIKAFGIFLLTCTLCIFSIQPVTQDLEAITPASQQTLLGQNEVQAKELPPEQEQNVEKETSIPNEQLSLDNNDSHFKKQEKDNKSAQDQHNESTPKKDTDQVNNNKNKNNQSNDIIISEQAENGELFFTTNLYDNQVITEPNYYLTITHLNSTLTVKDTVVELNKHIIDEFSGELLFIEGPNVVSISITYTTGDGELITATQTYNITLDTKNIIIETTAKDEEVNEAEYRFTAKAMIASEELPLDVTVNGDSVKPLAGYAYAITLHTGDNLLEFIAKKGTKTKKLNVLVHYNESKTDLLFETDLKDQKVTTANFTFAVEAKYGNQKIPYTISLNGEALAVQSNYNVQLKNGTNTIQLQANYNGEQLTKQYKILYSDPSAPETKPVDERAPKLKTDLKTGTHVKGLIKTINVWPTTSQGERIRGKNVAVKVNGAGVPFVWDDAEKTSYKLALQDGKNTIEIRAWDDEGRTVKEIFTITAEDLQNAVIGQVTISVEASVLGIPYLIPPTKMDIHQGEKGSYIVDQLLRKYGYSYVTTGTLDSNFYLSAIKKTNMLANVSIPDDLWALVESSSTRASRDDYNKHSLGEFDFSNGSGWMFSINGDYPNYGFSDAYFLDGDIVRIRYTLQYGRDIKGAGTSSSGSNWDKEW